MDRTHDWAPFTSRAGFELADFLFADSEMSQRRIDRILELWAATLIPHHDSPPIIDHLDLHRQIDAIPLGDIPWECFSLKYGGAPPQMVNPPEWKLAEHEIWYRNPRLVIKNILANPDFHGHINYAAYRESENGKRQYSNVMSGNWAWKESVSHEYLELGPNH